MYVKNSVQKKKSFQRDCRCNISAAKVSGQNGEDGYTHTAEELAQLIAEGRSRK